MNNHAVLVFLLRIEDTHIATYILVEYGLTERDKPRLVLRWCCQCLQRHKARNGGARPPVDMWFISRGVACILPCTMCSADAGSRFHTLSLTRLCRPLTGTWCLQVALSSPDKSGMLHANYSLREIRKVYVCC